MPNKLKFYMNSKGEKIYTLKENLVVNESEQNTKDAHHKFIKLRSLNPDNDEEKY